MKAINDGKQMTDVWRLPAIARWEKSCGKHPTQKPLALLTRIILASTYEHDWILDPFAGSSTTGIAANLCNRRYLGIEQEEQFNFLSRSRRLEIDDIQIFNAFREKIKDFAFVHEADIVYEPEELKYTFLRLLSACNFAVCKVNQRRSLKVANALRFERNGSALI